MGRASFSQTSFREGEWAPFSQGHSNTDQYYQALKLCENFFPMDEGALVRRPGTRFVSHARVHEGNIKLVPFRADNGETYVLELTAGAIRFYNAGAIFVTGSPITVDAISDASPAVVNAPSHGLSDDDYVVFSPTDSTGANVLLHSQFIITVIDSDNFSIEYDGGVRGAELDNSDVGINIDTAPNDVNGADICWHGGTVSQILERSAPYTDAEIPDIKYAQDQEYLYLFHGNHEPRRIDGSDLSIATVTFDDGPYLDQNTTATTLAFSGTSGSVTVTASAITGINGGSGFQETDIGRLIRVNSGSASAPDWSWLTITAYTSTTVVTATVSGTALASGSATALWRLGLYSDTTGWPTCGAFHEARLMLASGAQTARVDGSKVLDTLNFEPAANDGTVADDNAVAAVFNSTGRNSINWLVSQEASLLAGTETREWVVRASTFDDPITPTSIQARRVSKFGSSTALPVETESSVVFIQSLQNVLREHTQINEVKYGGRNISRKGRHLISQGLTEVAYSQVPVPIVWGRTTDNHLVACGYRNDEDGEQVAWHKHNINSVDDPNRSAANGVLRSITVAPLSDVDESRNDTLWIVAERNGAYCVEVLERIFDESQAETEAWFVDSGIGYQPSDYGSTWEMSDAASNTFKFYGLWHLEGDSVELVWRGRHLGQFIVTDGIVTTVIGEELLTLAGATSTGTVTRVYEAGLTFNTGYISDVDATDIGGSAVDPVYNGNLIRGLDDELYVMSKSSGSSSTVRLLRLSDGAVLSLTQDEMRVDLANRLPAISQVDPDVATFATAFASPETPHFCILMNEQNGGDLFWYYAWYTVNTSGTIEFKRGLIEGAGPATIQKAGQPSQVIACTYEGVNIAGNVQFPIAVNDSTSGDGTADPFVRMIATPNADLAIRDDFLTQDGFVRTTESLNTTVRDALWDLKYVSLESTLGSSFWNADLGSSPLPRRNRAFFLPDATTNAFLVCSYVDKETINEQVNGSPSPANTFIQTHGVNYPDGFIAGIRMQTEFQQNLTHPDSGDLLYDVWVPQFNNVSVMNCRFVDENGVDVMPFSDVGLNSAGETGSDLDDYMNPSVYPTDLTDLTKPWLIFWPKLFRSDDAGDKIVLRVFEWDPYALKGVQLSVDTIELYDMQTDLGVGSDTFANDVFMVWDRETSTLYAALQYDTSPVNQRMVFARAGTYAVETKTLELTGEGFDAIIGLNMPAKAQLLRPDENAGTRNGPALGKLRRIEQFAALVNRSGPMKFGTDFTNSYVHVFTEPASNGSRPLFSGVYHDTLESKTDFDNEITIEQDTPAPGTILAMAGFISSEDR
jgi:hypothetical protein